MSPSFRRFIVMLLACALAASASACPQAQHPKAPIPKAQKTRKLVLMSDVNTPPVPLAEHGKPICVFRIEATVDEKGEGEGTLELDPNVRSYNEFGDITGVTEVGHLVLDCTIKFVKSGKSGARPPRFEQHERRLYSIEGKKIASRLSLAIIDAEGRQGRLIIQSADGKGPTTVIHVYQPLPPEPCHPGCFPAGTSVMTPDGARPIDRIHAGDMVTTVRADGTTAPIKVQSVFVTPNRLVKVETDGGVLLTTLTQPLCLAGGQYRAAGELTAGDRIERWRDGKRESVTVLGVALTERYENVFNLVLGNLEVFIADGFLARSKPPGDAVVSEDRDVLTLPASRRE
jgi:hypothetical protein